MQGLQRGVHMGRHTVGVDGGLVKDGGLVPAGLIFPFILNGAQQGKLVVIRKGQDIALRVDRAVILGEAVVDLV